MLLASWGVPISGRSTDTREDLIRWLTKPPPPEADERS